MLQCSRCSAISEKGFVGVVAVSKRMNGSFAEEAAVPFFEGPAEVKSSKSWQFHTDRELHLYRPN